MRKFRPKGFRTSRLKKTIIAIVLLISLLFLYLEFQVRPRIADLTAIRAEILATEAINNAVLEEIESADYAYSNLMTVEYKDDNSIGGISTNVITMNKIKSAVSLSAQKKIAELSHKQISLYTGDLSGFSLLSGRGPQITIKLNFSGSIKTEFESSFESAGMNQTLHTINVKVTAHLFVSSRNLEKTLQVTTNIPIAETVIVGTVPSLYANRTK